MALKPTIYKLNIALSDLNRNHYDAFSLTIALHPSENLERMMARIIAYCLNVQVNYEAQLQFTKGLSVVEEPDIWIKTLDDQLKMWIDMGEPSPERIKKSSRLAPEVLVYSFNSKSDTWWEQTKGKVSAFKNVKYFQFDWNQTQQLASLARRNMDWSVSISDDTVYISDETEACEMVVKTLS
ncbi:YaeQ family protein [Marinicella rhabdoformis]|uniref:YaeQ family protein n=1 Tax=Marinicella rhabdoformis TaxID=2580566 RepID=UPI0012AED7BD|nr:YaeQ family protein [Marinicella rhabdoformis]